jgi:hypothetical protein
MGSPALAGQVRVTLLDIYCRQSAEESARAIAATNPDMVGLSVYLWNREQSISVARMLRNNADRLILFCGGPEATADPANLLGEAPFDFLIAGEGEAPLLRIVSLLLEGKDFSGTPGLVQLQDGTCLFTPAQPVKDLDSIPSPFLTGILPPSGYQGFLWQLSRGCCFECDFCFDAKQQLGVRRFGMERIAAELSWFADQGIAQVFVLDSTFNQDKKRAAAILRLIGKNAPDIHFHFEVRSEFIDREQAALFAAITCSLQIGLQSSHPDVLQSVNRSFNKHDFIYRIGLLNEAGAIFGFDLIYGLPGDTLAGFRESLEFALSLYPNHLDIFPLAILPGTRLASKSALLGLDSLQQPPYTLLASPSFPAIDMAAARKLATACDIFYSRGKAVAWFAAVTAALGISACSLLEKFSDYFSVSDQAAGGEEQLSDQEIWKMQRDFLQGLFKTGKAKHLLTLALDLVDYNYRYAEALMAVPPAPPTDQELQQLILTELPLSLAESARLATFTYEILEVLETGVPDLQDFARHYAPAGSFAVIYPSHGEVFTESLIEPYYRLLELLDGKTPAGQLAAGLNIPADEALSFLEFAVAEGIATVPADAVTEAQE